MKKVLWIVALFAALLTTSVAKADITSIDISGSYADPTITVNGSGFGSTVPPADSFTPPGTGTDYAGLTGAFFDDVTAGWGAGCGSPDDCSIGLTNVLWSDTQVVFNFGSCYNAGSACVDEWIISPGDSICATMNGVSDCGDPTTAALTPTPEPGTMVLWLTGIGLMILMRKRFALFRLDTNSTLSAAAPQ